MKTTSLFYTSLLAVSVLYGCSAGSAPRETWTDLVNTPPSEQVPPNLAGVIFYRTADAVPGGAVNVYANQEYIASLLPGAYQQVAICPDNQTIYAQYAQQDPAYTYKHSQGQNYNLAVDQIVFFEVVADSAYGVNIRPVENETGRQALNSLQRQNHTLPRLDRRANCGQRMLKQYTLEASALFRFDKSDYANMLERGKEEIRAVSQDMQQYMNQISNIEVIGHTDPDGSDSYNMTLSQQRAQTVKQALQSNGINPNLISTQGRGETQLLISDCEARHPNDRNARVACNQPNRRVEINLYGAQEVISQ